MDMEDTFDHSVAAVTALHDHVSSALNNDVAPLGTHYLTSSMMVLWTFLRTIHTLDDAVKLLSGMVNHTEGWLASGDAVMLVSNEDGEEFVEVPLYIKEMGGMDSIIGAATGLQGILNFDDGI